MALFILQIFNVFNLLAQPCTPNNRPCDLLGGWGSFEFANGVSFPLSGDLRNWYGPTGAQTTSPYNVPFCNTFCANPTQSPNTPDIFNGVLNGNPTRYLHLKRNNSQIETIWAPICAPILPNQTVDISFDALALGNAQFMNRYNTFDAFGNRLSNITLNIVLLNISNGSINQIVSNNLFSDIGEFYGLQSTNYTSFSQNHTFLSSGISVNYEILKPIKINAVPQGSNTFNTQNYHYTYKNTSTNGLNATHILLFPDINMPSNPIPVGQDEAWLFLDNIMIKDVSNLTASVSQTNTLCANSSGNIDIKFCPTNSGINNTISYTISSPNINTSPTYTVNIPAGIDCQTITVPINSSIQGVQDIYINYILNNDACARTIKQEIQVQQCQCAPLPINVININSSTNFANVISSNNLNTLSTSNRTINVGAGSVLSINQNYTFTNCVFVMGAGSKILVENNPTLTNCNFSNIIFSGCNFSGCNQLWQGIENRYTTNLTVLGCTIKNALYGILYAQEDFSCNYLTEFENGLSTPNNSNIPCACYPTINIRNNLFIDNHIGVMLDCKSTYPNCITNTNDNIVKIENNNFTEQNGVLPIYQNPYLPNFHNFINFYTYCGISVNLNNFWYSETHIKGNVFNKLSNGILVNRGRNISIASNTFQDILESGYTISGHAINMGGGGITNGYRIGYNDPLGFNSNAFNTCKNGVYGSIFNNSIINNNVFDEVHNAINLQSISTANNAEIINNTIGFSNSAITIAQADLINNLNIESNSLYLGYSPNLQIPFNLGNISGTKNFIKLTGTNQNKSLISEIQNNTMEDHYNGTTSTIVRGIDINSMNGVNVCSNTIIRWNNNSSISTFDGIRLINCNEYTNSNVTRRTIVNLNNITGASTTANKHRAINISTCPNTTLSANISHNTYYGIDIANNCNNSFLLANTYKAHNTGLRYLAGSHTGNQYIFTAAGPKAFGNIWQGPFANKGAVHLGNASLSLYIVNSTSTPTGGGSYLPVFQSALSTWFTTGQQYINYSNSGITCNTAQAQMLQNDNNFALKVAQGNSAEGEFEPEIEWADQTQLMEFLKAHPEWLNYSAEFPQFFIQHLGTNIDEWATYQAKRKKTMELPNTLQNQISASEFALKNINNQIAQFDTIIQLDSMQTITLSNLHNQKKQIESQWNFAQAQAKEITDTKAETIHHEAIDKPQLLLPEANNSIIDAIYYSTIAKGNTQWSNAQIQQINEIAMQCPLAGGNAVYRARSLYDMIATREYDDEALCAYLANQRRQRVQYTYANKLTSPFIAYPNPATNTIHLYSQQWLIGDIDIYNAQGAKVSSSRAWGYVTPISISQLSSGLYTININGQATTLKFTKQ